MFQEYQFLAIALLCIIIFSGCTANKTADYIAPELRASAINLDENQARQQAEAELTNDLGADYFAAHYAYIRTEPVMQDADKIGYRIYYSYKYDVEYFNPQEMYIYIGAAGPDHKTFYQKRDILDYPSVISFSDFKAANSICLKAFLNDSINIMNWSNSYSIDTRSSNLYGSAITLTSTGEIENTSDVISCEFSAKDGTLLAKSYGSKVPLKAVVK